MQTVVLAVSAGAGILVIMARGKQEGRRATVDLIVDQNRNEKLSNARKKIREMHEHNESNYARFLQDPDSKEYDAIMMALNTYEFVASGIRSNAFNEDVYKRLRYSSVIRDWESFKGFVAEFRNQKKITSFYQDFEWLYQRWKKHPLKTDS